MIIHTFHPSSSLDLTSLDFTLRHFTSQHFTPHFSLPCTFGCFVTTLPKYFTSPHFQLLS